VDLCVAGDAGTYNVADGIAAMVFGEFARELGTFRAGTNKAHVPAQHVPELREFVETGPPEIVADPCAARVAWHRPNGAEISLGVLVH